MNLLSYGATLKLVIGWQKKKVPNSPEMIIQLQSSSKSELSVVGAHFRVKAFSFRSRQSLQIVQTSWWWWRLGAAIQTERKTVDRLCGDCRLWKVLEQTLTKRLEQVFYSGSQMRDCQRQPARQKHQVLVKTLKKKETNVSDRRLTVAVVSAAKYPKKKQFKVRLKMSCCYQNYFCASVPCRLSSTITY